MCLTALFIVGALTFTRCVSLFLLDATIAIIWGWFDIFVSLTLLLVLVRSRFRPEAEGEMLMDAGDI